MSSCLQIPVHNLLCLIPIITIKPDNRVAMTNQSIHTLKLDELHSSHLLTLVGIVILSLVKRCRGVETTGCEVLKFC